MLKNIFKSWKTSSVGLVGSIPQLMTAFQTGDKGALITGIATLLMGLLAKDHDVTHSSPK